LISWWSKIRTRYIIIKMEKGLIAMWRTRTRIIINNRTGIIDMLLILILDYMITL